MTTAPSEEPKRIVLVEDEPALRENYTLALNRAGYDVQGLPNAELAIAAIKHKMPDVAIIDIGLGRDSEAGFDLCRNLRAMSSTLPIVFLTARDSELDIISGLRLGADDYLTKDISLAQLVARVSTLLRRIEAFGAVEAPEETRQIGQLVLNGSRVQAKWQQQLVELTVTEYWLIDCLARYPGQVRSRQQLMDAANLVLDDQTITAHIKRIRAKFLAIDKTFTCIQTVYGLGYRWVDETAD